jgi:hypothetical protein
VTRGREKRLALFVSATRIPQDPSAVVKTRRALKLDGNQGATPEYIIPNPFDSGAVRVDRVSGVNPEF